MNLNLIKTKLVNQPMPLGRHQNEAERIVLAILTGTKVHTQ